VRLERLSLAPYGRFADQTLNFRPGAALHVVLGANESGKTTTLSAIGDLLFGFQGRTPYGFQHDQALLRVGGGFRLSDGSALELRRRKGNKNTLVDAADRPIPEDELSRALGGVDRKTFETEFGLTAQALREGGEALLKAGGGLAETLAASSAGLSALSRLREKLSGEADLLFTPRKSASRAFYLALDRHEDADKRLRAAVVTADALHAAEAEVLNARAREVDLKSQHEETGRALARWRRAQRTSAKLARLAALAGEKEAFADLPAIAAATLAEWRAALADDKSLRGELDRLAADQATDDAAINALGVDKPLLDQGEAIDGLRERLGTVRKAADDLPRRVEARSAAEATLDDLARRLGLPDHIALLAAPPTDAAIARARALIAARRRAEEKHAEAVIARDRALTERDRLRLASGADAVDPEPFKRRLASLADVVGDADLLRRERANAEAEARALAEEAARLDPNAGDIDTLARLALPDEASVAAHLRAEEETIQARRAAETRLASARRAVELGEAALAKRVGDSVNATRADWLAARERRETGFDRLDEALDGEARDRRERFDALRSLALAADATADAVLADTERAARLQALREDLAAKRDELTRTEAEMAAAEAKDARSRADWLALWTASGLTPQALAPMSRWREYVSGLLKRRAELNKRRAEIEALARKVDGARTSLLGWLGEAGAAATLETFEEAHRAARTHLDAQQAAWLVSREREVAKARAEKDAVDAEAAVTREATARQAHAADWPAAMAGLGLTASAVIEEAEAALKIWEAVALPRQTMSRETRSIEGIDADLASFGAGVAAVVAAAAPAFAGGKPADTLAKLVAALGEARRAADARDRLLKTSTARALTRRGLEARRATLDKVLAVASGALRAPDIAALAARLERLEQRHALETERAALRRDLAEIADGLDEPALRAEQADLDMALVPGEIELAQRRQTELMNDISAAAGLLRDAQSKLDALGLGRDAAGAARDRAEASAELIDIAERWIVRQSAARLAGRAIESHRKAAQDPLVARAGEMFAIATAGGFAGLGADYDDSDQPVLVARRPEGRPVRVEGLSEGARDQLFLSLRLALLERRAGEPLPFIGDDILASFDDERARKTLALLAAFGRKRQVIVFTHHRHVAEIARGVGDADIDVLNL